MQRPLYVQQFTEREGKVDVFRFFVWEESIVIMLAEPHHRLRGTIWTISHVAGRCYKQYSCKICRKTRTVRNKVN